MGLYYPKDRETWYRGDTAFSVGPGVSERFIELSFPRLQENNLRFDVFISHQGQDLVQAKLAAVVLQDAGVSTYLDVDDPAVHGDSVKLEVYLRDIIRSTQALLAIVTLNAQGSWWVPFEIGVAREAGKVLSCRVDKMEGVALPSYLAAWPIVTSDEMLKAWAEDFIKYPTPKYNVDEVLSYLRGKYQYI